MAKYAYKDEAELIYDANKRRLRAEGAIALSRVMNEALNEMTTQFNEGIERGELLEIGGTKEEMEQLLLKAAQKRLGDGSSAN